MERNARSSTRPPPTRVLTLAWADILIKVPPALATKSLNIPFSILHERFRKISAAAAASPVFEHDSDQEEEVRDVGRFPRIPVAADGSDPVSEAVASDVGDNGNFDGVAETVPDCVGPRRSVRLAHGAA